MKVFVVYASSSSSILRSICFVKVIVITKLISNIPTNILLELLSNFRHILVYTCFLAFREYLFSFNLTNRWVSVRYRHVYLLTKGGQIMLLTIIELRNRMLNIKPDATVSVTFKDDDMVQLYWSWSMGDYVFAHRITVPIHSISGSNRSFEREMHKVKRRISRGTPNGGQEDG